MASCAPFRCWQDHRSYFGSISQNTPGHTVRRSEMLLPAGLSCLALAGPAPPPLGPPPASPAPPPTGEVVHA
eukprot:4986834-Prymnesium_polylepis.1